MSRVIPASGEYSAYFLTLTVVDWVDIFTRQAYCQVFVEALNYAVDNKGMKLFAWVLMSNHAHLVASADTGAALSGILRDLKKHTSKKIVAAITTIPESRAEWMLNRFECTPATNNKKSYQFWQEGNYPKACTSQRFLWQKIDYVHFNPVRAGIVAAPEHYLHSSAVDYAGGNGLVKVSVLER